MSNRHTARTLDHSQAAFWSAVAMMTVVPMLTFIYVYEKLLTGTESSWDLIVCPIAAFVAIAGYVSLRRHSQGISRIHRQIHRALETIQYQYPSPLHRHSDTEAVEQELSTLLSRLTLKLEASNREKTRLEEELFFAQKVESLGALATGVAHDFNNLLAAAQGNIGIAKRHCSQGPALDHLEQAEAITARAINLMSELLIYSGRGPVNFQQINLTALVRSKATTLEKTIPAGIKIEYSLPDTMPHFWGDESLIALALVNLVTNAAEGYQGNPGVVRITTESRQMSKKDLVDCLFPENLPEDLYAVVRVEDSGCGIPPQNLPVVFDPFFTTKIRARGMGLPMILGIMRTHSGGIILRSALGEGTAVHLLFPTSRKPDLLI